MNFDYRKLASDASGLFSRAKQVAEETFLKAERTELDAQFEHLLQKADRTEEHTKRLLSAIESYLQPNPTLRMEEVFYEKLELRKEANRPSNLQHLGACLTEAGNEAGAGTHHGSSLLKMAAAEQRLASAEKDFVSQCVATTLVPLRRFLDGDIKTIQRERRVLNGKRLDLDAAKSRLKKAKTVETQTSTEADVRTATAEFEKQCEITKLLLAGLQSAQRNQLKYLHDFVDAQQRFHATAAQQMSELQSELAKLKE